MALLVSLGSENTILSERELREGLYQALDKIGKVRRVACVPPDATRFHSYAGPLTRFAWEYYGRKLEAVLPAIGTHTPMTEDEIRRMFGEMPLDLFHVHDWRNGVVTLGEAPPDFIRQQSEGRLDYAWPAQMSRLIAEGGFDLILSIGQVVPHEVLGMANYNKNLFVGTGGSAGIHRSHFLGAVYGMERLMGRADNPVREVLNYASHHFASHLPVIYVQTVVGTDAVGQTVVRGLFAGPDAECFRRAADLSVKVNLTLMDREIRKAVVYLRPDEYRSTWLGNKAIYRTRMAMADGGEVIVLAPGVREFGEDPVIDSLVRKYGFRGTPYVLEMVKRNPELAAYLGVAAHLIHASTEGRFTVTHCPGHLTREEIEGVGFRYARLEEMMRRYDPAKLSEGFNVVDGEEIFYISNPALGLWASRTRFEQTSGAGVQAKVTS